MRIENVRCGGFGVLRDFDTGDGGLGNLSVIVGPNEAGKSTFFELLVSLLYGFRPASRDTHPYAPRAGGEIDIEADIALDDGRTWRVHRRLLTTPLGRLERNGEPEDLRNRPLPALTHIERRVFRQVYALTLTELAALETETWNQIQDRLIGAMGARDLVPIRRAAESLEQEAGALWRPTRHGNQRIREVNARVHEVLSRRKDALERDGDLRRLIREAALTVAGLKRARERREHSRLALENARKLQPIRLRIQRIEELAERAGSSEWFDRVPAAPGERLAEARKACEELESRLAALNQDRIAPAELIDAYADIQRGIVGAGESISHIVSAAAALEPEWLRVGALEQEVQDLERRRQRIARELLSVPVSDLDSEILLGLRTGELNERVRTFVRAREERERLDARAGFGEPGRVSPAAMVAGTGALLGGIGLLAWGSLAGQGALRVVGTVLLSAALGMIGHWWWMRRTRGTEESDAPGLGPSGQGKNGEHEALEAIRSLLGDLPIHEEIVRDPTTDIASSLMRLQELTSDLIARRASGDEIRSRMTEFDAEARALGDRLGLALPPDSAGASQALGRALSQADEARRDAQAAERDLERLEEERTRCRSELDEERRRLCALESVLGDLAGGDVVAGLKEAEARLEAKSRAVQIMDELRRGHVDLDDHIARIREAEESGEDWTLDSETLVQATTELDEMTELIEGLGTRLVTLQHEIAGLERQPTVDQVDGEEVALQEELGWLRRSRDRKVILSQILRRADRRFREEHQPDVIRKAGDYLGRITGGRYDRISGGEGDHGAEFMLHGSGLAEPVVVDDTTSTGTREQVYLALRLAIVDHLDRDQERLPLLLDEVFVNWDEGRRTRGLDLITEVARNRQVFLCTCHQAWADQLETRGARLVRL